MKSRRLKPARGEAALGRTRKGDERGNERDFVAGDMSLVRVLDGSPVCGEPQEAGGDGDVRGNDGETLSGESGVSGEEEEF